MVGLVPPHNIRDGINIKSNAISKFELLLYASIVTYKEHGGLNCEYPYGYAEFWDTATIYTRDAIYTQSNAVGIRECRTYSPISQGITTGGLYTVVGNYNLTVMDWYIAT